MLFFLAWKNENKRVRKNICFFDLVFCLCVRDAAPWRPELWVPLEKDVRRLVVSSESSSSGSHTCACEILLFDLCGSHLRYSRIRTRTTSVWCHIYLLGKKSKNEDKRVLMQQEDSQTRLKWTEGTNTAETRSETRSEARSEGGLIQSLHQGLHPGQFGVHADVTRLLSDQAAKSTSEPSETR